MPRKGDARDRHEAKRNGGARLMLIYDEAREREETNEVSGFKLTILLNRIISRHGFTLMPTE